MRGLHDKRVLITGAGSGIGRAIARRLHEEGCIVGILDVDEAGGLETVASFGEDARAAVYGTDISDYAQVEEAVNAFESRFGAPQLLVNNAGWDRAMPFLDTDSAFREKVIAINLFGPINVQHVVLGRMRSEGFGRVVTIASDAGRVGSSGEAVYSACKGGVIALTKSLARELVRDGITLNAICPGPTDTPILQSFLETPGGDKIYEGLKRAIPMRRLGEPEDYPGVVAFFLSDDAGYMTGQTLSVSGGLTMHG